MDEKHTPATEVEDEISQKLCQWQQDNPEATLTDIEEAVDTELAKLRGQLVETMAQAKEETGEGVSSCPQCGQKMVKNGRKKRKLQTKEGETIQLERQQWRCLSCGTMLFPPG